MARIIFLGQPDRYGRLGHQSFSLITPLLLAEYFNEFFAPQGYAYFANKYNSVIDYSLSQWALKDIAGESQFRFIQRNSIDKHGNSKFDFCSPADFGEFCSIVRTEQKSNLDFIILQLPFDQFPGKLVRRLSKPMIADLQKIFSGILLPKAGSSDKTVKNIVIHVRRGDVSPERHPHWYLPDSFYERLILTIVSFAKVKVSITIVTQGEFLVNKSCTLEKYFRDETVKVLTTSEAWINNCEIESFGLMLNADVVIGGLSSFSILASLIKKGIHQISCVNKRRGEYPHPVKVGTEIYVDDSDQQLLLKLSNIIPLSFNA